MFVNGAIRHKSHMTTTCGGHERGQFCTITLPSALLQCRVGIVRGERGLRPLGSGYSDVSALPALVPQENMQVGRARKVS